MKAAKRREIAKKAWVGLKNILRIYPSIAEDLKNDEENTWTLHILASHFRLAALPTINAAARQRGITIPKMEESLVAIFHEYSEYLVQWLSRRPEHFQELLEEIGLNQWPYFSWLFSSESFASPSSLKEGKISEEKMLHALMLVTRHPEVARLMLDYIRELQKKIAQLSLAELIVQGELPEDLIQRLYDVLLDQETQ